MTTDQDQKKKAKRVQCQKYLEDRQRIIYEKKIERILDRLDDDTRHGLKRIFSFEVLDNYLDCCRDGVCPLLTQDHHNYLIDISVKGYYEQRAYYYSIDEIWKDDVERYHKATEKVDTVFNCLAEPDLDDVFFEQDLRQLQSGGTATGALRRKAFWRFMERIHEGEQGNPDSDFSYSERFITNTLCEPPATGATLDVCKEKWKQSPDVMNGVDLYRFCLVRKRLSHPTQEDKK